MKNQQSNKTFTVSNIDYDTDGEQIDGLPAELVVDVPNEFCETSDDILDYIADEISNRTGFCHNGFSTTPEIN